MASVSNSGRSPSMNQCFVPGIDVRGAALAKRLLKVGHRGGVVELVVLGEVAEVGDAIGRLEDAAVEHDEGADVGPLACNLGRLPWRRSSGR